MIDRKFILEKEIKQIESYIRSMKESIKVYYLEIQDFSKADFIKTSENISRIGKLNRDISKEEKRLKSLKSELNSILSK